MRCAYGSSVRGWGLTSWGRGPAAGSEGGGPSCCLRSSPWMRGAPRFRQADPEKNVGHTKLRPSGRSLVDGELLAQSEVLQGQLAMVAGEDGEEPKQMEQQSDHRAEVGAGSGPTAQPLGRRMGFWRPTGPEPMI